MVIERTVIWPWLERQTLSGQKTTMSDRMTPPEELAILVNPQYPLIKKKKKKRDIYM